MDQSFGPSNLPRLIKYDLELLKKPVTNKEMDVVIKIPGPYRFTRKFFQNFKEALLSILFRIFQENEETKTFPKSFYETNTTLTLKTFRDTTKGEN